MRFILPALLAALLAWDAALTVAPWRASAAVQPIPEGSPTKHDVSLPMPVDPAPTFPHEGVDYAVRLTRQKMPAPAFTPPAWLMRWGYWGWPELDRTVK